MKTYRLKHLMGKSLAFLIAAGMIVLLTAPLSRAEENWKESFDEICGKVQGADSMSDQEIRGMMDRAEKLAPVIRSSKDPRRKVFLIRLKRCRGVYQFMLDTRSN